MEVIIMFFPHCFLLGTKLSQWTTPLINIENTAFISLATYNVGSVSSQFYCLYIAVVYPSFALIKMLLKYKTLNKLDKQTNYGT